MSIYVFDTSVWIALWKEILVEDVLPTVPAKLHKEIEKRVIYSPPQVLRELQKHEGDEVATWCKKEQNLFTPLPPPNSFDEETIEREVARIARAHPRLAQKSRESADYHIIAWAKLAKAGVVTQEMPTAENKIPGVCRKEGIQSFNIFGFMKEMRWKFK